MPVSNAALASVEGHVVQFYDRDDELADAVADFVGAGLQAGDGGVVVATPEHRASVEARLRDRACPTAAYLALDATETLHRLLGDDGGVDAAKFTEVIGPVLADVARRGATGRVRAFGEMVALLWADGDVEGAGVLESHWTRAADTGPVPFSLLCAYPSPAMDTEDGVDRFYDACGHHTAVVRRGAPSVEAWRQFEGAPRELAGVRRFVADALARCGRRSLTDDAAVVASELATNAVLHARTAFHVSVASTPDGVRIAVHDRSPSWPRPRIASSTSATGRGMQLIDALSTRWGTVPLPNRKAVWADLAQETP